jgi:hypothetical protein
MSVSVAGVPEPNRVWGADAEHNGVARIVIETDDELVLLDERDVHLADLRGEPAIRLLDRLEGAIEDAERQRYGARRPLLGGRPAESPGLAPTLEARRS